jgi:hypothetical protein
MPMMDEKRFWDLIAPSIRHSQDEQQLALQADLERLEPDEILAFHSRLWDLLGRAYRVDLWAAAYLIRGGCSDDSFLYFRCWLLARGKKVFEAALADPDSLVDVVDAAGRYNLELILSVPRRAWESRASSSDGDAPSFHQAAKKFPGTTSPRPQGEDFNFDDAAEMRCPLPRLAEIHLRR